MIREDLRSPQSVTDWKTHTKSLGHSGLKILKDRGKGHHCPGRCQGRAPWLAAEDTGTSPEGICSSLHLNQTVSSNSQIVCLRIPPCGSKAPPFHLQLSLRKAVTYGLPEFEVTLPCYTYEVRPPTESSSNLEMVLARFYYQQYLSSGAFSTRRLTCRV